MDGNQAALGVDADAAVLAGDIVRYDFNLNLPVLSVFLTATNTAVVRWPSPSPGWNLQQITSLGTTNWSSPAETVNDDGTNRFIILQQPSGNRFYRLCKF